MHTRIVSLYVLLFALACTPAFADYEFITTAELVVIDSETPPVDATQWRSIVLPRSWSIDALHPKDTRTAWYRITLASDLEQRQWDHILMLRHMLNVELWLDEEFVGSGGPVSEPLEAKLQRNWNRPILVSMPEALARNPAPQYLYARLISEPAYGVMTPVIIGTESSLRPWYRASYFMQITMVEISIGAVLFTGLLSLFIWLKMRQQSWWLLAVMSATWALPLFFIVLPNLPVREFLALRLIHWGVVAGACALLVFIERYYLGGKIMRLNLIALIPLLHGILLALAPDGLVVMISNAGQLLCQFLFVLLIIQILRSPQRRSTALLSVVAGLVVMLLAALHDVTLFAGSNTERWRWDTPLSYITQPLMLVILAWNGVRSFLAAARELSLANAVLQNRLVESEERIRQIFEEQERLERAQRLEAERELVYRDLHDDLGARLLSLVYQSEKGDAQDLARTALQDLRDIVSRVLSSSQSLASVLADSMAEQLNRALALGKDMDWDMHPELDSVLCESTTTLGLRMLIRELMGACLRLPDVDAFFLDLGWDAKKSILLIRINTRTTQESTLAVLPVLQKRLSIMGATLTKNSEGLSVQVPVRSVRAVDTPQRTTQLVS